MKKKKNIRLETVFNLIKEGYEKALKTGFVHKPMAYALYHTWKYVDSIEKGRNTDNED